MSEHTMTADEYQAKYGNGADDRGEMSAEEFRTRNGRTANDYLRNLDASGVNTESPAKVQFRNWLYAIAPCEVCEEYVFSSERNYRADWALPDLRIIFEYDGVAHHGNKAGSERDAAKGNLAQLEGWLFMRVNAASCNDGTAYLMAARAIKQQIEAAR